MKMRKLLASGVAASLAVTSLATAASAAEQSFDMGVTRAMAEGKGTVTTIVGDTLGASVTQTSMQKVAFTTDGTIKAYMDKNGVYAVETSADGLVKQKDSFIMDADTVETATYSMDNAWWSNGTLTVKGYKVDEDGKKTAVTKDYTLNGGYDNDVAGRAYTVVVLDDETKAYKAGEFAPAFFDIIEEVSVGFDTKITGISDPILFNALNAVNGKIHADVNNVIVGDYDPTAETKWTNKVEYKADIDANTALVQAEIDAEENVAAALLGYAITNGGYKVSEARFVEAEYSYTTSSWLEYPYIAVKATGANNTLMRDDIQLLSDADAYDATTNGGLKDDNQTYDDKNMGTNPRDFAGLASQVADFFNKQTNGTITFKFTTAADSSASGNWVTGGVPSTQIGIKNFLGDASTNDFALFINYDQTGSLQALTSLDVAAGTVSFDISDVLDALGGQTIGVIDNIYFGLAKGIRYDDDHPNHLKVEAITLAYDEDGDVDADIEEEDDDVEAEDDVDVEEDDDVEIEDDATEDDDVEIDDDTTEEDDDDANVGGDVIVETEDDDANPGTGVALAVVPALVAAAAVVVSKKRS